MTRLSLRRPDPRLSAAVLWPCGAALLMVFGFLAFASASTKSATIDEPSILTAGMSYWARGDFRPDPENGNLLELRAALAPAPVRLVAGSPLVLAFRGRRRSSWATPSLSTN
ncbi:MAG: hypothetical protein AB1921_00015 [Thermodesulfobacteriota bacterium]